MKVAKGVGLCYFSGEYDCRGLDAVYLKFKQAREAKGKDWLVIDGEGGDIQAFEYIGGSTWHIYQYLTDRRGVFIVQGGSSGDRPKISRVNSIKGPVKRGLRMVSEHCRKANGQGLYYNTTRPAFQLKGWFKSASHAHSEFHRIRDLLSAETVNKAMAVYPEPYEFDLKEIDGASCTVEVSK